jgi:hypothetical protein
LHSFMARKTIHSLQIFCAHGAYLGKLLFVQSGGWGG